MLHTPGHTHHHVAYAVARVDGEVEAVFTGGSMLYGSTGRTDLLGAEHTDTLTHAQYRSCAGRWTDEPRRDRVFPSHGFGSFCAATPTSGTSSTIAEQRAVNPALTQTSRPSSTSSSPDWAPTRPTTPHRAHQHRRPGAGGPVAPRAVDAEELAGRLAAGSGSWTCAPAPPSPTATCPVR